jgi:hypothetical protein
MVLLLFVVAEALAWDSRAGCSLESADIDRLEGPFGGCGLVDWPA